MTLHDTTELMKKGGIGASIGIGCLIVLIILFRIGVVITNALFPPKIVAPVTTYGPLPAIQFPKSNVLANLTYTVNTLTGTLPELPDRLTIFPIVKHEPNFLNLDKAKRAALLLGFVSDSGAVLPEASLGNGRYEWLEKTGIHRKLVMDTVTFNFTLSSDFLSSLTVLEAQNLSDEKSAIQTTKGFLDSIQLFPGDIDLDKTQNPDKTLSYITYPQLFSIRNSQLVPTTSLSKVQVIRVDLYQKDIEYELNTGKSNDKHELQKVTEKLPILYPHPPYSTMNFLIASGDSDAEIVQANFFHQDIDTTDIEATYPIKSAEDAFTDLKNGNGYVATYNGNDSQVLINNVFLAYYLGDQSQPYLMPIIVFEGDKNFFAYVSAVKEEWVK